MTGTVASGLDGEFQKRQLGTGKSVLRAGAGSEHLPVRQGGGAVGNRTEVLRIK